jgi:predicted nucleic acid-binding protein
VATELRTFVDTDVLIDVARKNPRAIGFWRRSEARSRMTCSVISLFELLAGCRNLQEQRVTVRSLATVDIIQIESGDSIEALQWYRSYHLSRGIGFLDCFIAAAMRRLDCQVHTLIDGVRHNNRYNRA